MRSPDSAAVPLAAWFIVKPVRVAAPTLLGFHCPARGVCVEDESQRPQAERLYADAAAFVATNITAVDGTPRFVFCSTEACADAFGSAITRHTADWHMMQRVFVADLDPQRLARSEDVA